LDDVALPEVLIGDWAAENDIPVTDPHGHSYGRLSENELDDARRAYFAQLMHLDDQVGRLLNHCRRNGLMKNTWIIFMSDHGELLGDHHMWRKIVPWEGSARVPLVMMPPMDGEHNHLCGTVDPRCLTHADIMPTLLKLAGIAIPDCVDGKDILGDEHHEYIHGEHAPCWQYVTDGKEKFAWQSTTGKQWFFDLQTDPQELRNRVDDPTAQNRVTLWRTRLIQTLATRPQDGLTDGKQLIAGTSTPAVRV
jgi:arylsulfatase A-like enzyme